MLTIVYGAKRMLTQENIIVHVEIVVAYPMPSADDGAWSDSVRVRKQRLVVQVEYLGIK